MNIVVVSAFRNSVSYIDRYFDQIGSLTIHANRDSQAHSIRVVAVEGDSQDKTTDKLKSLASRGIKGSRSIPLTIINHAHGKRVFSSTEDSDRLSALTGVMQSGMAAVDPTHDDVVLYVESDIIWHAHQVGSIIDLAYRRQDGFDIVAPMVFAGDLFYDVWAFRKNGNRFSPFLPYHSDLQPSTITEVDSVGSCLAFRSELAELVSAIGEHGLVSWCAGAKSLGYRIGVASDFQVKHP